MALDNYEGTSFTMTGPGATAEAGHLPVRGDLAHIRLAGRFFVPHYAVPMPQRLTAATELRKAGNDEAEAIENLPEGTLFNVLDIAGGWAWGQVGDDGFVGYLPIEVLEAV
ncbi:MAG: SH3 domain-containing protein [Novosphingobium sp.]